MDVSVKFVGGGSIVNLKPVFSTNGESIFVASKNSISQYNTRTGKEIYQYKGWDTDVIGFDFHVIDSLECLIACSKSGQLLVWKVGNKVILLEAQIPKQNVTFFGLVSGNLVNGLDVLIAYKGVRKQAAFCIVNTKKIDEQKVVLKIPKRAFSAHICKEKFFAVVMGNVVYFVSLQTFLRSSYKMAENNRTFTCVACHPEEEIVITGDDTGRVVLWQGIFSKKTQAVFHWHTLPVNCVAFSTLGSHFYSGANESVLVKWIIENPSIKQFLPRLPAGIAQLAVSDNNAYVAVATSDNAIRIIDSRMSQVGLIQQLVLGTNYESGITYDPITRSIVMNGNVGCVQFYSPSDMSLLYNVDIVNQNKLTDERNCKIENTEVIKLALSEDGRWLATTEERKEGKLCKELRLKFWFFDTTKQSYELNTSAEFPHEGSINSVQFQPSFKGDNLKCITVGNDKSFKVWQVIQISNVYRSGPVWKCVNIGSFRDMPCRGLSFSIDGSLFAIAFGPILTVWAAENCELKSSLLHSSYKEKIKCIQFGKGSQCHLIVTASKSHLCVWNILTLTLSWVANVPDITLLVADSLSTYMILLCNGKKNRKPVRTMYIFEPAASTLLFSSNDLIKESENIVAATFVPSSYSSDTRLQWYERTNLFFMTARSELYCISKSEEPYVYKENVEDFSEKLSIFDKIKPKIQTSQVTRDVKQHMFRRDMSYKGYKDYIEAPLETLPPISLLAASLLKSLVIQREEFPKHV
ncbi:WD repeat-containing protein 75-like [Dendroctonus ponderosae]|uniref:WD repeat-containing protein 75 second beta-propeller domain-containing protein n=1 Tax=Dendroctonus ponderosae TaxID=77166 RepID=U4UE16_DENPD|nr:WD repeat-containing protein 75 [Dendroctonus ponderosae]XP_048521325.1 WD repeat-containing protein 75-like [Dendroctonus ponderosae]ERL83484.1 hypothetical protein D910_00496 [Dendroctonus ponderosae]ERL88165.1 hypothetical protein D910_05553 [Dendroctonus ponderosae]